MCWSRYRYDSIYRYLFPLFEWLLILSFLLHFKGGHDSCQGDSGGPLQVSWVLIKQRSIVFVSSFQIINKLLVCISGERNGWPLLLGWGKENHNFYTETLLIELDLLNFCFLFGESFRLSLGVLVVRRLTYPVFVRVYQSLHHGS